ncbi:PIR Superfamily Protein [Plasmodium ovale curtisi]|uniref:PIR Superfamily Protein n=1 Tax=Plasmodium ovale curtisi TaxID=864141 RepID=A0A1A8X2G8_PLAOA|nr:PIR Superfamily Protein [Plasmodium ovale curtisi]
MTLNRNNYETWEIYSQGKQVLKPLLLLSVGDILSFSSNVVKKSIKNGNEIIKYCIKLKKYLKHCNSNNLCDDSKCCGYINYWLNYNMRGIDPNLEKSTFDIYDNFMKDDAELKELKLCTSKISYIENEIFNEMKKLYDLYDTYSDLKELNNEPNFSCSYAKACVDSYNKIISICLNKEKNNNFCEALQNLESVFKNNEWISKNKCEQNIPQLLSPQEAHNILQGQSSEDYSHSRGTSEMHAIYPELGESSDAFQRYQRADHVDIPLHTPVGVTIPIVLVSLVGSFLLLLFLYKFTPFGIWLTSRIRGIKKMINIKENKYNSILLNTSDNEENDLEDRNYTIHYHSSQNI